MDSAAGVGSVCLVLPCFNEGARIRPDELGVLLADPRLSLVLVDDGSTDDTAAVLASIAAGHERVVVVTLDCNVGKGEAVRQGLLRARAGGQPWVGYIDADLATPVSEVFRLLDVAGSRPGIEVVMGSRVALLGRDVRRSAFRHYTGRVFATGASRVLRKAVYDTQCGAKLFRATDALDDAISTAFRSRWAFDVELLGRIAGAGTASSAFWEEPLLSWRDVADSRRTLLASVRSTAELFPIWRSLRSRR